MNWEEVEAQILQCRGPVLLNCTWVNNETGVIFPLSRILLLKQRTGCFVHVDAVQSVGKIENWRALEPRLDAYTFSSHKFGGLKGSGFSLVSGEFPFLPLIAGRQEGGLRAGTENLLGIITGGMALEQVDREHDFASQKRAKDAIENSLVDLLGPKGEVVARESLRNGNTIFLVLHETLSQISTLAFDLAGVDVGSGSACSSGAVHPSRILLAMGYSERAAKSGIRLSFSPCLKEADVPEYWEKLVAVLERFA